jgi:hypothetical protein
MRLIYTKDFMKSNLKQEISLDQTERLPTLKDLELVLPYKIVYWLKLKIKPMNRDSFACDEQ